MKSTRLNTLFMVVVLGILLIPKIFLGETHPVIKVGIYNFNPLVFINEAGEGDGFFIDILKHIAEREHWEVEYIPGSWNESLDRLVRNEIDLLPSIAYSEERARKLDFTADNLFLDWGLVYKPKGSPILTIFDLQDKTVSVLRSSIYTTGFKQLLSQFSINCRLAEKDEYT